MLNKTETAARELTDKELAQVTGGEVPAGMTLEEYINHPELQEYGCQAAILAFSTADDLKYDSRLFQSSVAFHLSRPKGRRPWCLYCQSFLYCSSLRY